MSRYFVTGSTGFIGGRVAHLLHEAGHAVATIVRDPAKADSLRAAGVEVHRGDITDIESMRGPMRGCDGVFHIAGWYKLGVRDPGEGERVNVRGTRTVLTLMRELGIAKGVYTSTLAVNGDTHGAEVDEDYEFSGPFDSAYDRTKWRAHRVAEEFIAAGLPLVIVQPGLVYGPGDTSSARAMLIQFLQRELPLVPAQAGYSWAHIDDIAHGHLLAMERGRAGQSYHLAGPACTLVDALALSSRLTGVQGPRFEAPWWLLRGLSVLMTPLAAVFPIEGQYHPEMLRVMAGATYYGRSDKAFAELGWAARPLEAGLRETLGHEMKLLGMKPIDSGAGS